MNLGREGSDHFLEKTPVISMKLVVTLAVLQFFNKWLFREMKCPQKCAVQNCYLQKLDISLATKAAIYLVMSVGLSITNTFKEIF